MFGKIKDILGFDNYEDDDFDDLEDVEEDEYEEEQEFSTVLAPVQKKVNNNNNNNKVVNIHTNNSAKLMITKPIAYDDAPEICNALKNRKIVVLNTTSLEIRVVQRLIDFISGACYALGADLQEVEKGVFIVAPSNVEVNNELKNELTSKGIFNWSK